jgi:hypothetical protein
MDSNISIAFIVSTLMMKYDAIEKGLQKINNDKLFQTYKSWKEINEKRENEQIKKR